MHIMMQAIIFLTLLSFIAPYNLHKAGILMTKRRFQLYSSIDFERKELLRNLGAMKDVGGSWFKLNDIGKRRFASGILQMLELNKQDQNNFLDFDFYGSWEQQLCNEDLFRFWLKGMRIIYTFNEMDDNFEQSILLNSSLNLRIKLKGYYFTPEECTEVEFRYETISIGFQDNIWEFPYSGGEYIGCSYFHDGIWLEVKDKSGNVTLDSTEASKFKILTKLSQ